MNHNTAAKILEQLAGEANARQNYEQLLADCPDMLDEDVKTIQEIQRDEANHMLKLQAMAKKYDGGLAASSDDAEQALDAIKDGI